jgi:hypothetical protein
MPDRRTFLISFGGVVAAPVLAQLSPFPGRSGEVQWTAGDVPASMASVATVTPATISLRIDGWESTAGSASDVWVHINSSWRATWR